MAPEAALVLVSIIDSLIARRPGRRWQLHRDLAAKGEIAQQRNTNPGDLKIARRLGAIGLRLAELQPRLTHLGERRQPAAVTQFGDGVRASRLVDGAAHRFPHRLGRREEQGHVLHVALRLLLRLLHPHRRLLSHCLGAQHVGLIATTGEDRHIHANVDRPVGEEPVE